MSLAKYSTLCILVAFSLLASGPAFGWECTKLDSEVCACNCYADLNIPGQGTFNLTTSGEMEVEVTECEETPDGREIADMNVKRFDVDASSTPYGSMQIRLDASRTAPASTYVTQIPYQEFPATHDMYAHCTVTFSGLPGVVWRSIQPFHMQSTNVNSIFPSINEDYDLVSQVDFENISNPGVVVGTLTGASITVDH